MDASTIIWTPGSPAGASILGASLDHVTNAYKHLWLTAIMDQVVMGEDASLLDDVAIGIWGGGR